MTQTIAAQLTGNDLFIALELSVSSWKVAISSGGPVRVRAVEARDVAGLLHEVEQARVKAGVESDRVLLCYEAGRDGFWLQRLLASQGFHCVVVDPSSIQVDRRARHKKTDRIDATKLCMQLSRWHAGDADALHVTVVPSEEQEDERRRERELETLKKERARHSSRIKGLLALHGIVVDDSVRIDARFDIDEVRQWNGEALPENFAAEVRRELQRLAVVEAQIRVVEVARREDLKAEDGNAANKVKALTTLRGIASGSAWTLALEAFAWRKFDNRKQLASYAGLDPSPYESGDTDRGRGISKAGNHRIRTMMVELAWSWLRLQPQSELSRWFNLRFGEGKRTRRIGIVALARKLLIALWRYLEQGVVPVGASLKEA